MAVPLTVNGVVYTFPEEGDTGYAGQVTAWATALTNGSLQLGGTYALLSELVVTGYGIKSPYFKSGTTNAAAAGQLRLAKTDTVSWRNNANGADLPLTIDTLNNLQFNSVRITGLAYVHAHISVAQTGISSATTIVYDVEDSDTDNLYNNATGIFTCATAGDYQITAGLLSTQVTGAGQQTLAIVQNSTTIAQTKSNGTVATGASGYATTVTTTIRLAVSDTLKATIATGANTVSTVADVTSFISIKRCN